MHRAPTHDRVLRLTALLWIAHGLFVAATPVSRTHARATVEQQERPASAGTLDVSVTDEHGSAVFARVTAVSSDGEKVEGLARGQHGVRLSLATAGSYLVRASRGLEWSIAEQRVAVQAGARRTVHLKLRRQVDPGGYVGCDFHLHSEHSPDSAVPVADRIASVAAEGLDFAVPTDHNAISSFDGAVARDEARVASLPGVELTTWAPSIGHFNVFPARYVPEHERRAPDELFAELRADPQVVIQVNHPRLDDHIAYFHLGKLDEHGALTAPSYSLDFDVLEVWNGYDLARPDRVERVFREWLAILSAGHRIAASGNSDSHDLARQRPGYPRTYVWIDDVDARAEPTAVAAALKAGRAFVTSGPLLDVVIEGERPGATVETDRPTVTLRVRVQAASWMRVDRLTVWGGTRIVHSAPIEPRPGVLDVLMELELPVAGVPFLVVAVSGATPMDAIGVRQGALPYGFANPIWIKPTASRATRQYNVTPARDS